jgi:hypothetical protein
MLRYTIFGVLVVLWTATAETRAQEARIVRARPVYDVLRENGKGMLIRMDLEIDGLRGQDVNVGVFFNHPNGTKLLARPGIYSTPSGHVTTQRTVTPEFPWTNINNLDLFIPYDELTLGRRGVHFLKFNVEIKVKDLFGWKVLDYTGDRHFQVTEN